MSHYSIMMTQVGKECKIYNKKMKGEFIMLMEKLNHKKINEKTATLRFNCGGYALGIQEWIKIQTDLLKYPDLPAIEQELLIEYGEYFRFIEKEEEATKNEDIVYFRLETDDVYDEQIYDDEDDCMYEYNDFHFIRCFKDTGELYHKCGNSKVEEFEGDVYDDWDTDCIIYSGKILLMAVPKAQRIIPLEETA